MTIFKNSVFALLISISCATAATVDYELTISQTRLEPAGKSVRALTINDGIPGPTLRFRQGDTARIIVHNGLKSEQTSLHWHGLLLPNAMDGVPYLTTPPIEPGQSYTFEFPLRHSGTYWYHSHTGLQEQRGVYGAIVVEPRVPVGPAVDYDFVTVLSDWTNERPTEVMRTLMRGSEWYGIKKGNAQSIAGAAKAGALDEYIAREKSRMPPMDVSDVAYDALLINGSQRSELDAKPGDRIRLRLINAGASTYFYITSATGPLTILAADGPEVEPVEIDRLLMGMAETYDLLFTVPPDGKWELRATSQDNSGHASLFIGDPSSDEIHHAPSLPSPDLYHMDEMVMGALTNEKTPLEKLRNAPRPIAPYEFLQARQPTTLSGPRREITLRLTGDMQRYIWSFNDKTLAQESTIPVTKGEVLRIELINDTMMHHPLHLHGHFFRVINRHGSRSPLKHTIDVPPMGSRTIEFLADEEGDWFFHCHLLYHMDAGMARVFSYRAATDPDYKPALDPKLINPWFLMLDGMVLNNMTMGMATAMTGRENFTFAWDYGFDQSHTQNEYDLEWSHYFNPNLSSALGYRLTDDPHAEDRAFAGIRYRLPYMIGTELTADSEGDLRISLGKELQLTQRLSIFGDVEYDTNTQWEYSAGSSFILNKQLSATAAYSSHHGFGAGISFRF